MTLQMNLDSLEGLDEATQKFYVEKDGKYVLDVDGHEKNDKDKIPLSRLNQEIEKRKQAETTLNEVADNLIEDVPEDKRSIIPDLPAAQKIKWIKDAFKMGIFDNKPVEPIDPKRPAGKKPTDFENMSPQAIMATGYNKS